jgi:serine/threonine protein kinase
MAVVPKQTNDEIEQRPALHTDRYQLYEEIGSGTWGRVYRAFDKELGMKIAIKIIQPTQEGEGLLEYRTIDLEEAVKKEAGELAACSNVIPTRFERDNSGKPFIVMPLCKGNYAERLIEFEKGRNNAYFPAPTIEEILKDFEGIAKGVQEMHKKLRRTHNDLKPANILVDNEGSCLIGDLGNSSLIVGYSNSPRDNMGGLDVRAPECFQKDSHPTTRSDVYSFGALLYSAITGESLDPKTTDKIKAKKLKKVPKKLRKFMAACLATDSFARFRDGSEMFEQYQNAVEELKVTRAISRAVRKFTPIFAAMAIPLAAGIYGSTVYEPKELTMPKAKQLYGIIDPLDSLDKKPLEFEREHLTDLPDITEFSNIRVPEKEIKNSTRNRYAAYLHKTYHRAIQTGRFYARDYNTEAQQDVYIQYTAPDEKQQAYPNKHFAIVAKAIEVALSQSQTPNGKVDLEDICTTVTVGRDKLDEARRAANSFDFASYSNAKDNQGKPIIPKEDIEFIKHWLAFVDADE